MATSLYTNNAKTTLSAGITNVATSIPVAAGYGALFPAPSAGDFFYATLTDVSNNIEIVKVTSRATDTMTVVRGQEGTTARAYLTGDKFQLRITAASLTSFAQLTATQTLTNKTLDTAGGNVVKVNGNTLAASAGTATVTVPNATDTLVGKATTDTLTNKTIDTAGSNTVKVNGNTLAASAGTATVTLPNSTDTLVGRATTDTLTNKTLTDPVINGGITGTALNTLLAALPVTGGAAGEFQLGTLYIKWGSVAITPATDATVTFTNAYPTACAGVYYGQVGTITPSNTMAIQTKTGSISASGFIAQIDEYSAGAPTRTCYWLSFGY